MARAIGIDLGTTNSLVAFVDERNRPRTIAVDEGGPLVASAVRYGADGTVLVGAAARAGAGEHPEDTVLSVKRLMGRATADLAPGDAGACRVEGAGAPVRLRVGGGLRVVTPVEVSAEILRVLRRRAAVTLGGPPGGCVVTVPAYFDDAQRQATRDAARLAGLEVLRLLAEPTAAALAYGLDQRVEGTYAVYDLGGGTFDASILRLERGVFEVLATAGDTHLGGDDLDRAVAAALLAPAPEPLPPTALLAARALRERLSTEPAAEVEVALPGGPPRRWALAREELERLVAPILGRTEAPCRDALREAGVARVDGVVLVGGATRTPLVRRMVRALFGREPFTGLDPDTVVALGAAVQADALDRGGREDLVLLDVVPLTLGLETMGGVVEPLVPRNATIPASATQRFTTHADGQTGMVFHVVQGERELADDCRSLARFTLKGLPPRPAGEVDVEVTFAVDVDGLLRVSAQADGGAEVRVQVRPTHGLSEAELERMLVEALEHAEADVAERFLRELRLEGARTLAALDEALREDAALLQPGEGELIAGRAAGLRRAMTGDDFLAVKAWIASLDDAARPFVERRVDAHVARALAGRRVDEL